MDHCLFGIQKYCSIIQLFDVWVWPSVSVFQSHIPIWILQSPEAEYFMTAIKLWRVRGPRAVITISTILSYSRVFHIWLAYSSGGITPGFISLLLSPHKAGDRTIAVGEPSSPVALSLCSPLSRLALSHQSLGAPIQLQLPGWLCLL